MYERRRNIVTRSDGRKVNVARFRGQLFVCSSGCCCGRTEDGFAPVPAERFHTEWERRRLRNVIHLTVGGCLGPCGMANVVMLLVDGQAQWFHSINSEDLVSDLYEHIESLLDDERVAPPLGRLAGHHFTGFTWQPRTDGQPVDDRRPRRPQIELSREKDCPAPPARGATPEAVERVVAQMNGPAALPRKNGELVFEQPWHGRAFGMAVALHEAGLFSWDDFRSSLTGKIAGLERSGQPFEYYEAWLAALESTLANAGAVPDEILDEVTYQFEFGERDDVY